jgi:hypothetical protein
VKIQLKACSSAAGCVPSPSKAKKQVRKIRLRYWTHHVEISWA